MGCPEPRGLHYIAIRHFTTTWFLKHSRRLANQLIIRWEQNT